MSIFHFALDDYSSPLLWGNFIGHYKEAQVGSLCKRTVHLIICAALFLPIISQVGSLFEKNIVETFSSRHQFKSLLGKSIVKTSETEPLINDQAVKIGALNKFKNACIYMNDKETIAYHCIDSGNLVPLEGITTRQDFFRDLKSSGWPFKGPKWSKLPVLISKSEFVPKALVEHIMRNKKDIAFGVKYEEGDLITRMEGAVASFISSVCPILTSGDFIDNNGSPISPLNGLGRQVILNHNMPPDFEKSGDDEVMMKVIEVKIESVEGRELPRDYKPLRNKFNRARKNTARDLGEYEDALQRHMIYHLNSGHRLPALHEISKDVLTKKQACKAIEELINYKGAEIDIEVCMKDVYVELNGHTISLEALFKIYLHQNRNEFSVLDKALTQGYIYSIDSSALSNQLGLENHDLLDRLQILAFKHLTVGSEFANLKAIAFSDTSDKAAIALMKSIFPEKIVMPKEQYFQNFHYENPQPLSKWALVIKSNSSAFGQNIQFEGSASPCGVIGSYSNAAWQLQRDRADLLEHII